MHAICILHISCLGQNTQILANFNKLYPCFGLMRVNFELWKRFSMRKNASTLCGPFSSRQRNLFSSLFFCLFFQVERMPGERIRAIFFRYNKCGRRLYGHKYTEKGIICFLVAQFSLHKFSARVGNWLNILGWSSFKHTCYSCLIIFVTTNKICR